MVADIADYRDRLQPPRSSGRMARRGFAGAHKARYPVLLGTLVPPVN